MKFKNSINNKENIEINIEHLKARMNKTKKIKSFSNTNEILFGKNKNISKLKI